MYERWTWDVVAEAFEHYSFAEAWSNWAMQAVILALFVRAVRRNRRSPGRPALSGFASCMLSLIFINLAASAGHGIEHVPRFERLAAQIRYTNFALVGFASLFLEYWVLERIAWLARETPVPAFQRFPTRWFKGAVVLLFVAFQAVNWWARAEPDFLYAIVDYGASMLMMAGLAVYVMGRAPSGLDTAFERWVLWGVLAIMSGSVAQQLPAIREALPYDGAFHFNDLYHLVCIVAFVVFERADRSLVDVGLAPGARS